jgi:threonine/homoserine/homoserine lactone efflux protein
VGQAISEVLPFAVGVAIVPIPVIAMIVVLFSSRARANGPAFLVGWIVGLSVAFTVVYTVADAGDAGSDETASDTVGWLRVVLGVILLLLAGRTWRKRPPAGDVPELPKWMAGVDYLQPLKALGLGLALSALNPKNLVLVVGAAAGIAALGASGGDAVVALVVFVVVGSLTIGTPLVYYFAGGARATSNLEELKAWLGTHNDAIMAVLFLVFGAVLVANGLAPLTSGS